MPPPAPVLLLAVPLAAALAVAVLLAWRLRAQRARDAALRASIVRISHDIRGALSPALLMAERLESHADPQACRAGELIAKSVERAAELARQASVEVKQG